MRISAAKHSNENSNHVNLPKSDSLVQVVIDNFDLEISPPKWETSMESILYLVCGVSVALCARMLFSPFRVNFGIAPF